MPLPIPKKVPALGFYYHYKHDPSGAVNNYAYEVVGVGFHTEDDCRPGEEHFVVYRPLSETGVYRVFKSVGVPCFYNRPLEMWMGNVQKDGKTFQRFQKITDPKVIAELEGVKEGMY